MPEEIILLPDPAQEFDIVLDEQQCIIRLRDRLDKTYMTLIVDGETVFENYVCYDRQNIKPFTYMNFNGCLVFRDLEGRQDPVYTGFNTRYFLLYYSEGEDIPDTIQTNCN